MEEALVISVAAMLCLNGPGVHSDLWIGPAM